MLHDEDFVGLVARVMDVEDAAGSSGGRNDIFLDLFSVDKEDTTDGVPDNTDMGDTFNILMFCTGCAIFDTSFSGDFISVWFSVRKIDNISQTYKNNNNNKYPKPTDKLTHNSSD